MTAPTVRRYPRSLREAFQQPLRENPALAPRASRSALPFRERRSDRLLRIARTLFGT